MTNLDSVLKSKDITLPTKVCIVMVLLVITYGCESWIVKKAEHQNIDAFELWCWRRQLRDPCTAVDPNGNQPCIFIGGLMLKLKLQYFGHLMQKATSLGDSDAGKD